MSRHEYLEVKSTSKTSPLFGLVGDTTGYDDFDIGISPLEDSPVFTGITPKPGFCVKLKTDSNEKMFINVCHCSDIPAPPPSMDVVKIICGKASDEEGLIRFPLSLGEPHMELDKSGKECKCFDVVVNSDYFEQTKKDGNIRDFIMTLAVNGLERKYDISIDVGTCTFLRKPYHGKPPVHYIKLMPSQEDLVSAKKAVLKEDDIIMPVKNPSRFAEPTPDIPSYQLFLSPTSGNPRLLMFQGIVNGIKDKNSFGIDVNQNMLTVSHANGKILCLVHLRFDVIPEKSLANFWKNRLFVAMPINSD